MIDPAVLKECFLPMCYQSLTINTILKTTAVKKLYTSKAFYAFKHFWNTKQGRFNCTLEVKNHSLR